MKKSSQILESILTHDESFLHALIQKSIDFNLVDSDERGISPQEFSIELDALIERHEKLLEVDSGSDHADLMNKAEKESA